VPEKKKGNGGIDSIGEIAGELKGIRGEEDGPKDQKDREGRCIAEIWVMPNNRAQLRCDGEDRFMVQQSMRDILLNVDRELMLEVVDRRLKEFEVRIMEQLGGKEKKRVWTPEGRG